MSKVDYTSDSGSESGSDKSDLNYDNSEEYGVTVTEYDVVNMDDDALKEYLRENSNLSKEEIELVGKDKNFIKNHIDDVHEYIVDNCESSVSSPLHVYSLEEENEGQFIHLDAYYNGTTIECDSACLTFENNNGNYVFAEDNNYFVLDYYK